MTPSASDAPEKALVFRVAGMDCAEEVALLRDALADVAREDQLSFDVLNRKMTVRVAAGDVLAAPDVLRRVAAAGLRAESWSEGTRGAEHGARPRAVLCLLSFALLVLGYVLQAIRHGPLHALAGEGAMAPGARVAFGGAVLAGAWFVVPKAWGALRRLRPDMNLLMVVAIVGALLLGEWFEGAAVSALFALALLLESWSVDRARRAIERLLDLSPKTARVVGADGTPQGVMPIDEVAAGTRVSVRAGERVPLDAVVESGSSHVDQAPLTGESVPVAKRPGDAVYAGTINTDAMLIVRTTRAAHDSTLARIIHMVEDAHARRAPTERWVERFALRYTPIMMGLALLVALVPPLAGWASWTASVYRALVVLVIACPCALVISTPVSLVAALASAARSGVLIKGGAFLEAAAQVHALAIDKTGTLTRGKPVVHHVQAFQGHTEEEILAWACGLESRSNHPLARAVVAYAHAAGVSPAPAESLRELPGLGAEGLIGGKPVWIGGHRLVHERDTETPDVHAVLEAVEADGYTAVALGEDDHVCSVFALADEIRPEARSIVDDLHAAGVRRVVMLTGDHEVAARRVAEATGVDEVHADLLPDEKVRAVEAMNEAHGQTAMVGDGINDAPALAASGLGIAMGAMGSDVAIETADVALMSDDLSRVPWLIRHARRTLGIIRQNVVLALGAKAVVMVVAGFGVASLWLAIAADMGASLVVIGNALRLLREQ